MLKTLILSACLQSTGECKLFKVAENLLPETCYAESLRVPILSFNDVEQPQWIYTKLLCQDDAVVSKLPRLIPTDGTL